ncbi:MAG: hypothetical protein ACFFDT_14120, partial [Candidatus Hodarchaeota archaeon]
TTLQTRIIDNGTVVNAYVTFADGSTTTLIQKNLTYWSGWFFTTTPGFYSMNITAEDDQGFTSIFTCVFRKSQDITVPLLERNHPIEAYILSNNKELFVSWSATDIETGIAETLISINESTPFEVNGSNITLELPVGNISIQITTKNFIGLSTNISFFVFVDVNAPILIIDAPKNGTTVDSDKIWVNWTTFDLEGLTVTSQVIIGTKTNNLTHERSYLVSLLEGWNLIGIKVQDQVGNYNMTTILVYREKSVEAPIELILISIGSLGAIGGGGILLWKSKWIFKKFRRKEVEIDLDKEAASLNQSEET